VQDRIGFFVPEANELIPALSQEREFGVGREPRRELFCHGMMMNDNDVRLTAVVEIVAAYRDAA
jgi:phosphoribosyl-ATP pyrophosphohydrolase